MSETMSRQIITETFLLLLNVITELNLILVSIYKGDIEFMPWHKIRDILNDTFRDHRILICTNQISISPLDDCPRILKEYHDYAPGGYKGVTKTYLRIKARYYWPN